MQTTEFPGFMRSLDKAPCGDSRVLCWHMRIEHAGRHPPGELLAPIFREPATPDTRAVPLLMDRATLMAHESLWGEESDQCVRDLPTLTECGSRVVQ